jgi:hypothetical protein
LGEDTQLLGLAFTCHASCSTLHAQGKKKLLLTDAVLNFANPYQYTIIKLFILSTGGVLPQGKMIKSSP